MMQWSKKPEPIQVIVQGRKYLFDAVTILHENEAILRPVGPITDLHHQTEKA